MQQVFPVHRALEPNIRVFVARKRSLPRADPHTSLCEVPAMALQRHFPILGALAYPLGGIVLALSRVCGRSKALWPNVTVGQPRAFDWR
jgi:hypothetical protein